MQLSVIITAYNLQKEIVNCLESVHNQEIKNVEFIIVDDGSTDNTKNVVKTYLDNIDDDRFRYVYKENGGVADARNFGIKIAKGKYIMFMDGDDSLTKDRKIYAKLISIMNNNHLDILEFNFRRIKNGIEVGRAYYKDMDINICSGLEMLTKLYENSDKFHPEVVKCIYKLKYIKDENIYYERLAAAEDRLWLWQIFLSAKKVMHIHNIYYNYITRSNSFMHTHTNEISQKRVHDNIYGTKKLLNIVDNNTCMTKYQKNLFIFYFIKSYISDVIEGCSSGYNIKRLDFIKTIIKSKLDIKDFIKSCIVLLPNFIRKKVSKKFYIKYIQQV